MFNTIANKITTALIPSPRTIAAIKEGALFTETPYQMLNEQGNVVERGSERRPIQECGRQHIGHIFAGLNAVGAGQAKRITVLWVVKRGQLSLSLLTVEATEASGAGNMA